VKQPATLPRFAFVSSCLVEWGGSEALWAGTALHLAQAGYPVRAFKTNLNARQPALQALLAAGCRLTELSPAPALLRRLANRLLPYRPPHTYGERLLARQLRAWRPELVLLSQGANYDGFRFAAVCRQLGLPYVLLAQKVTTGAAPYPQERALVQASYLAARRSYFVSHHNRALTELQLGLALPGAEVVWNPYNVPFQGADTWPAPADGVVQLACVARLYLPDKGQDLLLQALAQPQWRARAFQLTLYGAGPDESAIREMVQFLGLQHRVRIAGHVADIDAVWQRHHALVLPSRHEGLPLSLVEAMLAGRPAIATDAGGIAELLTDNETGFLAAAPTVAALSEALERAWAARTRWPQLGAAARARARATVPADAPAALAHKLLALVPGVAGRLPAPLAVPVAAGERAPARLGLA
jgi:glycosyltransferase involved in cell wall biosynthesis